MGVFSAMEDVEVNNSVQLPYLNPDQDYVLEITEAKMTKIRNGDEYFVTNFLVLASTDSALPPGKEACNRIAKKSDYFRQDVKKIVGTAHGADADDPQRFSIAASTQNCNDAVEGGLKGKVIGCKTYLHQTKAGKDFAKTKYYPTNRGDIPAWNMKHFGTTTGLGVVFGGGAPASPVAAPVATFAPPPAAATFAPPAATFAPPVAAFAPPAATFAPPVAAPPVIAPPPMIAPAPWAPPVGWAIHPQSPIHVYELSTGKYMTIEEFRAQRG